MKNINNMNERMSNKMSSEIFAVSENFKKIKSSFFEDKIPLKKFFTITYGPPGSGKSDLVSEIWKKLNVDISNVIDVNVDKMIEQINGFKSEYQNSKNPYERDSVYLKYRRIADEISEDILTKAIEDNYHIVWETTGKSIDWAMKTIFHARSHGYIIFLVYPFVDKETLFKRTELRADDYEKRGYTPRRISEETISSNVLAAQINIEKLVPFIDKVAIYDNTKSRNELSALWKLEKDYIGYCEKNKDNEKCENGIIHKITCSNEKMEELKEKMESKFYNFLQKQCHPLLTNPIKEQK